MAMKGPLTGIRIVDMSQAHAGPFGTQMLGDMGADVIKIEAPERGDLTRMVPPKIETEGYYILALNRNKKSIELDFGTPSGKEVLYDLVKVSDVVFDNFKAGAMEKLGADYETLKKINPQIICCSITGYGPTGPYRDRMSVDDIAQGLAGAMSLCGEPGGPPMRPGIPIADISAGIFAAMGVIIALYDRKNTGEGRKIDINLLDSTMFLMSNHFQNYFISGIPPGPQGSKHPFLPLGAYQTKNGHIMTGVTWPQTPKLVNREWLLDDPRFDTFEKRFANRKELDEIIEDALREKDSEYWLEVLQGDDVTATPVNTLDKVVADPQVVHNKTVLHMDHPLCGAIRAIANPIHFNCGVEGEPSPPATLGQHTDQVLREVLGYSEEKVKRVHEEIKAHAEELEKHTRKKL
ncbi:MAG: CaiB/BaiF CoA-transferase family protein [Thermodesulfobacteriota bacterium]|nr:CaiB/BaiF CoA-transferase family protein [Thermodesulfobacteriota bacterium]